MNHIILLLCEPDPATFPVQDSDRSADLVPPELPPKGFRRRKLLSKVTISASYISDPFLKK